MTTLSDSQTYEVAKIIQSCMDLLTIDIARKLDFLVLRKQLLQQLQESISLFQVLVPAPEKEILEELEEDKIVRLHQLDKTHLKS